MFEAFGASLGLTLGGCLFLAATSGAAVYFFMKRKKGDESESLRQMQTILYEEIHRVRELVTIRKPFAGDISFDDDRKIFNTNVHMPFSDRKLVMTYSGMIVCGCDLDKIRLAREGNTVKIFVPRSRILDYYADIKSFKVHYKDTGLLAKDFQIEEQNAIIKADLENRQWKAVQSGILAQADEEVRQELTAIISRCGLNKNFDVEIVFRGNDNARILNSSQQNLLR
ncbi:MAG: DUF4230 domain-containing protein [Selenomonadaceae bacterium]|nr:DUF4230 domain-containing protein [Selenomonadaceae bacterium]